MLLARLELLALRALFVLGIVGAIWFGIHAWGMSRYHAGYNAKDAEDKTALAAEIEKVRADEASKRTAVETAHAQDVQRLQVQTAAATAARSERDRLREYLSSRAAAGADPAARTGADDPSVLRSVLTACTGRYEDVARAAGEATQQVIGLQNYIAAAVQTGASDAAPVGGVQRPAGFSGLVPQPPTAPSVRTSNESAAHL